MSTLISHATAKLLTQPNEVERAYRYCQRTARVHAKSFYFSAQFLPRAKRRAVYAVYALCRHVDDAVDEAGVQSEQEVQRAVEGWRRQLDAVYERSEATAPVLIAWRDMLRTYSIPRELPVELMRGVLMDTHIKRYATWAELRVYCWRVASTVGLMVSEIFGYRAPETLRYAETLGVAMQLTNILRDIKEDADANRIYLPQEDLHQFSVTEDNIMRGPASENFCELLRFEVARARSLYREAEQGIRLLDRDARFTVLLAARLYARILDEIERARFDIFSRRAHVSFGGKVRAAPRIWREARRDFV